VRARINANGDGIELYDTGTGGTRIKVEDTTGTVAKNLNIAGTATGVGVGADNKINGSFEKVVALLAGDTLNDVVRKINEAGADATAAVISDGAGATPFRLALTSKISGRDGRFIVDTGSVDLGLSQLAAGENALAFFGAGDVASSIAVSSSSNIIDDILPGVKIDLKGTSQNVINLNITSDNGKLTESVNKFIEAFNGVIDRINTQTKYDKETNRRSPLTGDGTAIELKSGLSRVVQQRAESVTGRYQRLVDIGIKVGKDSKLEFDADKFGEAMATDPESVEALLTARTLSGGSTTELEPGVSVNNPNFGNEFSSLGAMGQVERLVDRYVNSIGGVLTQRNNGIQRQVDLQTSRISLIDVRLARRREVLERQFAAMESTVGRLQQQGASLGSLGR
jgi:flagellar hook-associated protein 2